MLLFIIQILFRAVAKEVFNRFTVQQFIRKLREFSVNMKASFSSRQSTKNFNTQTDHAIALIHIQDIDKISKQNNKVTSLLYLTALAYQNGTRVDKRDLKMYDAMARRRVIKKKHTFIEIIL